MTKLQYPIDKILDYLTILLFFCIPPLFTTQIQKTQISLEFSAMSILLYSALIVFILWCIDLKKYPQTFVFSKANLYLCLLLYINMFFWNGIGGKLGVESNQSLLLPTSLSGWLSCIIGTIVFASFEEILYRFFLPVRTKELLHLVCNKEKIVTFLSEGIPLLLFTFAHRYLGLFPLLNSLFAGILLRYFYTKNKSIFWNSIIHSLYNFSIYFITFYGVLCK